MLLSGTVVTAMGIVQMEQNRLRQQEIEVRALVAISGCENRTLANKINQEIAQKQLELL